MYLPNPRLFVTSTQALEQREESLHVIRKLFETILGKPGNAYAADESHPESNFDVNELSEEGMDTSGNYVKSSRVSVSRNLSGYLLSPSIGFYDRREVEKAFTKGLEGLDGGLKGEYHPLLGNGSVRKKPYRMSAAQEEESGQATNLLFSAPTDVSALSTGMGRH